MRELWIDLVEVLTLPSADRGDTRAFTNVVTWASTVSEYVSSVTTVFEKYGWSVLGIENERPVASQSVFSDEIAEIIESAKYNPNACIFATFYTYPSKPS
jgi:hypothetical protein